MVGGSPKTAGPLGRRHGLDLGALAAPFFCTFSKKNGLFALNDLLSLIITSIIIYMMNGTQNTNNKAKEAAMFGIAVSDVSIALARKNGTLRIESFKTRDRGPLLPSELWWAVSDNHGTIEVFPTKAEAEAASRGQRPAPAEALAFG